MKYWLIVCLSILSFGSYFPEAGAQFTGSPGETQVSIALNPQYPSPFEQFSVTLSDYSLGTAGNTISWQVDGELVANFANLREVRIAAPAVGEAMTIVATVTTPQGDRFTASRTIRPLYIDIIVEPYTYAPALYRGRSLPSFGSRVLLTALLHDVAGIQNAGNYSYTWSINNRVLNGGPVQGGFQSVVTVPHGRDILLGLSIINRQGEVVARRLVTFPSAPVDIQLYEVSPLFGLSHIALADRAPIIGGGTTIRAVPYNLDIFAGNNQLATEWQVDGVRQPYTPQDPFEITVIPNGTGRSEVRFKLRHIELLLQGGERGVTLQY